MGISIKSKVDVADLAGLSDEHKKAISKLAAAVQPMVVGLLVGKADKAAALDLLGKGEITTVAYMAFDKLITPAPAAGAKKTVCPVTPAQFMEHASPIAIQLGESSLTAVVKAFSTGSFGWNYNGKVTRSIGGKDVKCQVSLNVTVIGSKPGETAE